MWPSVFTLQTSLSPDSYQFSLIGTNNCICCYSRAEHGMASRMCPTTTPVLPSPRKTETLHKVWGFSIYSVYVLEANEKQVFEMYNGFFHYMKQVSLISGLKPQSAKWWWKRTKCIFMWMKRARLLHNFNGKRNEVVGNKWEMQKGE